MIPIIGVLSETIILGCLMVLDFVTSVIQTSV